MKAQLYREEDVLAMGREVLQIEARALSDLVMQLDHVLFLLSTCCGPVVVASW